MIGHEGAQLLDRAECLALLGTARVGRVVYTHRAMPAVEPVRFSVRDDAVVFAASSGSALFAGALDNVVAFEVDDFDPDLGTGWYVTVLGWAAEAREAALLTLPVCTWTPTIGKRYLRIPVTSVSGHRVTRRIR